jgi:hypothetical protein
MAARAGIQAALASVSHSNPSSSSVTPKDTAIPASASNEWAKNLDDKERLFVEGYLQTLNKLRAAEYAGFTFESARKHAYTIFNRPHVREAIEHLLRTRNGVTKAWLIDKLVAIIDTDLADVSDWDESGRADSIRAVLARVQKSGASRPIGRRGGLQTIGVSFYGPLRAVAGHRCSAAVTPRLKREPDGQSVACPPPNPLRDVRRDRRIARRDRPRVFDRDCVVSSGKYRCEQRGNPARI